VPAGLKELTHGTVPPTAEEMARHLSILPFKEEAFQSWSPGQTWFAWCSTTSTTITTTDTTWTAWNNNVTSTTGSLALNYASGTAYVSTGTQWLSWNTSHTEMTEEQAAAFAEAQRAAEERRAAQEAERAALTAERGKASERAVELLLSLLTPEQAASYQEHGWFEVRGSSGRRWRIRNRGQSGNVDLMPEIGDEREMSLCAHPAGWLPDADAHVAQMLALVTDDEAFARTANVHYRRPGSEPPFMRAVA
jgi:hypothetical protein